MINVNATNESIKNSTVMDFNDITVVGIWSVLLVYALITNLLTVVGISKSKNLRTSTSYWLIMSVSFCDLMMIVVSLTHILPATLYGDRFVLIHEYRNIVAIFAYNVFWYSGVVQLAGMAVNRYISIVHMMHYRRLFTPCYTVLFLSFMYLIGVAVSLPALFPCCYMIYDHQLWLTYYVDETTDYYIVDLAINSLSLAVMILCYSAILWKVRKTQASIRKHQTTYGGVPLGRICKNIAALNQQMKQVAVGQPSRREMKLFTQFLIVSLVFLLTFLMWQWLYKLQYESKWIYFTTTTFFFVNNAVNPTVYLIYNSTLRKELRHLFSTTKNSSMISRSGKSTVRIRIQIDETAVQVGETTAFIKNRRASGDGVDSADSEDFIVDERFVHHARFASLPGVPYYLDKTLRRSESSTVRSESANKLCTKSSDP